MPSILPLRNMGNRWHLYSSLTFLWVCSYYCLCILYFITAQMSQLFVFYFYLIFFTDVFTVTFLKFLLSYISSDWTCGANQGLSFLNQYISTSSFQLNWWLCCCTSHFLKLLELIFCIKNGKKILEIHNTNFLGEFGGLKSWGFHL